MGVGERVRPTEALSFTTEMGEQVKRVLEVRDRP